MTEIQGRYVLPTFTERTSYGFKELSPYTKLFEERIIFLGAPIDDTSANDVMAQLLCLDGDVGSRTADATRGLVHHDPRVRRGVPLALGAGAEQELPHARR